MGCASRRRKADLLTDFPYQPIVIVLQMKYVIIAISSWQEKIRAFFCKRRQLVRSPTNFALMLPLPPSESSIPHQTLKYIETMTVASVYSKQFRLMKVPEPTCVV